MVVVPCELVEREKLVQTYCVKFAPGSDQRALKIWAQSECTKGAGAWAVVEVKSEIPDEPSELYLAITIGFRFWDDIGPPNREGEQAREANQA